MENNSEKTWYIRIMKGEIGPDATQAEANKMAQTIYNREGHKDINKGGYDTLKYPNHDYQLSKTQYAVFENAYNQRSYGTYATYFWHTQQNGHQSNKWYTIKAESGKTGKHWYFTMTPNK